MRNYGPWLFVIGLFLVLVAACSEPESADPTSIPPTPTTAPTPTRARPVSAEQLTFITVATDVPDRSGIFADFDPIGNVVGFDAAIMEAVKAESGIDYEFVVTRFDGMLDSVASGQFDAALAAIIIPDTPQPGITYSEPYLQIGQVLVVLADESAINSTADLQATMPIGVIEFTSSEATARDTLQRPDGQIVRFATPADALQALADEQVRAVILDHYDAEAFAQRYYQQLRIVGGEGQEAWIAVDEYGFAVAEDNPVLLDVLNQALTQIKSSGTIATLAQDHFVAQATIDAGESRVGTPDDQIVIGVVGSLDTFDPAATPDILRWELLVNTMGGLLMYDAENNLVPALATGYTVSESGLEYTFTLREGVVFPDGTPLTAQVVKQSIDRIVQANVQGLAPWTWHVNNFLKDSNGDSYADIDAVQVTGTNTVKFILKEPTAFFPSLIATPPYFVTAPSCDLPVFDPLNNCKSIGMYDVAGYEPGISLDMRANPNWPGTAPAFDNIQMRFYPDATTMRNSLLNEAIDVAWLGLGQPDVNELTGRNGLKAWPAAYTFKSHLVFDQSQPPWDSPLTRRAVAYALDRDMLATVFGGERTGLFSPVPDSVPGYVAVEPQRDLLEAVDLLNQGGYSAVNKLAMDLWFVDDGRYSFSEADYAREIKRQLEETGVIEVNLLSAGWDQFQSNIGGENCNYPTFLVGWPTPGLPPRYLEPMSWMYYFMPGSFLCINYDSIAMDAAYEAVVTASDSAERQQAYAAMQQQWVVDYPTLNLTQAARSALSLAGIEGVQTDAMGFLHYEMLTKP
jgi:ABC-type transport system substrate-binding protein